MENKDLYILDIIRSRAYTSNNQKYNKILNEKNEFIYDICTFTDQTFLNVICPNIINAVSGDYIFEQYKDKDKESIIFNLANIYPSKQIHINNVNNFIFHGCSSLGISNEKTNISINAQTQTNKNVLAATIKDLKSKYVKLSTYGGQNNISFINTQITDIDIIREGYLIENKKYITSSKTSDIYNINTKYNKDNTITKTVDKMKLNHINGCIENFYDFLNIQIKNSINLQLNNLITQSRQCHIIINYCRPCS